MVCMFMMCVYKCICMLVGYLFVGVAVLAECRDSVQRTSGRPKDHFRSTDLSRGWVLMRHLTHSAHLFTHSFPSLQSSPAAAPTPLWFHLERVLGSAWDSGFGLISAPAARRYLKRGNRRCWPPRVAVRQQFRGERVAQLRIMHV